MSRILRARYTVDVYATVELEDTGDDLLKARIIERAQQSALYPMRKELEKKMAELKRDDLTFTLEEATK